MTTNNNFYLTQRLEPEVINYNEKVSYYLEINNTSYLLKLGVNNIGRDESCEIKIDDVNLSRKHAMIEITKDGSVFIQDLCSANKTFRNNCELRKTVMYELINGNILNFGKISAKFIEIANSPEFVDRQETNESQTSDLFSDDCVDNKFSSLQLEETPANVTPTNINLDSDLDDTEILEDNSIKNDKNQESLMKIQSKNIKNFCATSTPSHKNQESNKTDEKNNELRSVLDNLLNTEIGFFIDSSEEKSQENIDNSILTESLYKSRIELKSKQSNVDIFRDSQSTTDEELFSETDLEDNNNDKLPAKNLGSLNANLEIDKSNRDESEEQMESPMIEIVKIDGAKDKNFTESESSSVLIDIAKQGTPELDKGIINNPIVTMSVLPPIGTEIRDYDDDNFDNLPTQILGNEDFYDQVTATQVVMDTDKTGNNCSHSQALYSQIATQPLSDSSKLENLPLNGKFGLPLKSANHIATTQVIKEFDETSSNDGNFKAVEHKSNSLKLLNPTSDEKFEFPPILANQITSTQVIKETDETNDNYSHSKAIEPISDSTKPENSHSNFKSEFPLKTANQITVAPVIEETDKTINNHSNIQSINSEIAAQALSNPPKPDKSHLNRKSELILKLANEITAVQVINETDEKSENNHLPQAIIALPDSPKTSIAPPQNQSIPIANNISKSRKTLTHKKFEKEITEKIVNHKAAKKSPLIETRGNKSTALSEINRKIGNFNRKLTNHNNSNNPMDIFEFRCDTDDFIDENDVAMVTSKRPTLKPKDKRKRAMKERNVESISETEEKCSNYRTIEKITNRNAALDAVVVLSDLAKSTNPKSITNKNNARGGKKKKSELNPVDIDSASGMDQSGVSNREIIIINNGRQSDQSGRGKDNSRTAGNARGQTKKKFGRMTKEKVGNGNNSIAKSANKKSTINKREELAKEIDAVKQKGEEIPDPLSMATSDLLSGKRKRGRPRRSTDQAAHSNTGRTTASSGSSNKRIKLSNEIDTKRKEPSVKIEKTTGKRKSLQSDSRDGIDRKKTGRRSSSRIGLTADRITIDESQCPAVMFTGFNEPRYEQVIRDLGGELIDDVAQVDCLVTDKVRRTVKFLCCLARGVPIVSPDWLLSSQHSRRFLDTSPFILKNNAESFNINLETSIELARKYQQTSGGIMAHYKCIVYIAGATKPDSSQLEQIISCAGGKMLSIEDVDFYEHLNDVESKHICVTDAEVMKTDNQDLLERFGALKDKSIDILSVEFILTMIMEQKWPPQQNYRLELVN